MKSYYVIKKGFKFVFHGIKFLKRREVYKTTIVAHPSWWKNGQECRPGHDKIWGIVLGWIHGNSYRFSRKNVNGKVRVGWYCHVGGVSPQKNKEQKGLFGIDIKPFDVLDLSIFRKSGSYLMVICNRNSNDIRKVIVPKPKGIRWPITMAYPNNKCRAKSDMLFDFSVQ